MIAYISRILAAAHPRPPLEKLAASHLKDNRYEILQRQLAIIRLQGEVSILERQDEYLKSAFTRGVEGVPAPFPLLP